MKPVQTTNAPAAVGPYSQACLGGDLLFVSGQLPLDPKTGQMVGSTAAEQVKQCLANVQAIAEAAGTSIDRAVRMTVLMADLTEFAEMNEVYKTSLSEPYPSRVCYQVAALPMSARVEIEAIIAVK